jgi:hypothetical protein
MKHPSLHSVTVASPRTLYSTPGFGLVCVRTPTGIPSSMHFMRPRFVALCVTLRRVCIFLKVRIHPASVGASNDFLVRIWTVEGLPDAQGKIGVMWFVDALRLSDETCPPIGVVLDFVPAYGLTSMGFEPTKSLSMFAFDLGDRGI